MISPLAEGRAAELLLSAHAMEILARAMLALQGNKKVGLLSDQKRLRLQAVGELIKSDLRHPWTIAELARHAGLGRRMFSAQFHRMYGVSASDYLRKSRLAAAREALLYQGLSVTEAAYSVGYEFFHGVPQAFRICAEPLPSRQTILTRPLVGLPRGMCPAGDSHEQSAQLGKRQHANKGFLRKRKGT